MMHLAAALALLIGPETPQDVGGCAWSHLPQTEQQAVLTAYDRGMSQGMRALSQRDAALQAGVRACANRSDLPLRWSQAAVASHVIQLGASARVARDKGLDRTRLDAAWTDAGDAPRNCALDNAAKPFGIAGPGCQDRRAGRVFLERLGLSSTERADRVAAEQALIYMNAKAQQLIVDQLIARAPVQP